LNLDVPRLTYQQIKQKAQNFLNTYHPSLELPVPIEEIIEFEIGLNIADNSSTTTILNDRS